MLRWNRALLPGLLLMLAAVGCQNQNQTGQLKTYSNDGRLGITDVNPNMPTSPGYHHYSDDVRMMREAIAREFPVVTDTDITLTGPVAHVRLTVPAGTPVTVIERLQNEAIGVLAYAAPRYRAQVSISTR